MYILSTIRLIIRLSSTIFVLFQSLDVLFVFINVVNLSRRRKVLNYGDCSVCSRVSG